MYECRMRFTRGNIEILHRFYHDLLVQVPFLCERVERGDDGHFGIHFKEAPQLLATLASAKAIRAEGCQTARHPRRDLVRNDFHVIRDGNKRAALFPPQLAGESRKIRRCNTPLIQANLSPL